MSCPYQPLLNTYGAPNIKWCEDSLCALVQEPANTWSNVPFVLLGLWILFTARGRKSFTAMGTAVTLMGVFSFFYHASNLYVTQVFDFLGMFLYLSLVMVWNLRRGGILANLRPSIIVYYLLVYANIGLLVIFPQFFHLRIQLIIFMDTIIVFGMEAFLVRKTMAAFGGRPYSDYGLAVIFLCIAAVCSTLDLTRRWCDPGNHWLQGHATWHVLNALSIIFVYRFYSRVGTSAPNVIYQ